MILLTLIAPTKDVFRHREKIFFAGPNTSPRGAYRGNGRQLGNPQNRIKGGDDNLHDWV